MKNVNALVIIFLLLNSCSNPKPTNETSMDSVTVKQTNSTVPKLALDTLMEEETDPIKPKETAVFDSTGRPIASIFSNLKVDTSQLFGVWSQDLSYPTAEFTLSKKYYLIADYDGNGAIPYMLEEDILTVFFEYGKSVGRINRTANDTLSITWDYDDPERKFENTYFRYNN